MNVLFVCTGNTCRSPMAEALLRDKLPHIHVKSAGIYANEKETANENAIKALKEKNVSLVHSSQSVSKRLLEWATIILTMTESHKLMLLQAHPQYNEKIFTLIEYVSAPVSEDGYSVKKDIADPFGGSIDIYRKTVSELEYYINHLTNKLNSKSEG